MFLGVEVINGDHLAVLALGAARIAEVPTSAVLLRCYERNEVPRFASVLRTHADYAAFLAIGFGGCEEHCHIVFAIDQIIGASRNSRLSEIRQSARSIP